MLYTPAYIFTLLLSIWVLSLVGCIVLGFVCYRLLGERKRLRARLEEVAALRPGAQSSSLEATNHSRDAASSRLPIDVFPDGDAVPPAGQ